MSMGSLNFRADAKKYPETPKVLPAQKAVARAVFIQDQQKRGESLAWDLALPEVRTYYLNRAVGVMAYLSAAGFKIVPKSKAS